MKYFTITFENLTREFFNKLYCIMPLLLTKDIFQNIVYNC